MIMKQALGAGLIALWAIVPGTAFAHDTWLLPERGSASPGAIIALDLTSGMAQILHGGSGVGKRFHDAHHRGSARL